MTLCAGLLAGAYPAIYATSIPQRIVLNGSFGLSPKGKECGNVWLVFSIRFQLY